MFLAILELVEVVFRAFLGRFVVKNLTFLNDFGHFLTKFEVFMETSCQHLLRKNVVGKSITLELEKHP